MRPGYAFGAPGRGPSGTLFLIPRTPERTAGDHQHPPRGIRPRRGGARRRRGSARRCRRQGDRPRPHHAAPSRVLLLRLRRRRSPAGHPPCGGQARVPARVDRHVLRPPGARRGHRRRGAPPPARRAGRGSPRPDAAAAGLLLPRLRRRRRGERAVPRLRLPARGRSGAGARRGGRVGVVGLGRVPRRRRGSGQRPVTVGAPAGPPARPPARLRPPRPARGAAPRSSAPPPRVARSCPASCAFLPGELRVRVYVVQPRTVRFRPASAPDTACGTISASSSTSGPVQESVASCRSPTSSGPKAHSV